MTTTTPTVQALVGELPADSGVIPLPVIRDIVNRHLGPWDAQAQSYAVKSGAIRPVPERQGRSHAYAVDRSEAVLILVAAALAFAAGVALVGMIRAVRVSGLDPAVFVQTAN